MIKVNIVIMFRGVTNYQKRKKANPLREKWVKDSFPETLISQSKEWQHMAVERVTVCRVTLVLSGMSWLEMGLQS